MENKKKYKPGSKFFFSPLTSNLSLQRGFTLIELIVVIAVLGILATIVAIAVNPAEQLAKARDAGRKNNVGQLVNVLQSYYVTKSTFPSASALWITGLINEKELSVSPQDASFGSLPSYSNCETNPEKGYCYISGSSSEAVVYVKVESNLEKKKCSSSSENVYFLWNSRQAMMGIVCAVSEPLADEDGNFTFKY